MNYGEKAPVEKVSPDGRPEGKKRAIDIEGGWGKLAEPVSGEMG